MVLSQKGHRFAGDCRHVSIAMLGITSGKMLRQCGDVFGMFAQRGNGDGKDVEAVKQVRAKGLLARGLLQIFIGGSEKPDVNLNRTSAAHAHEFSFLQNTQQLGLKDGRKLANFIQKNGAAFGNFEKSFFLGNGAGECALFVAKQFALQQSFGKGGAVQGYKRLSFSRAVVVNGAGGQLLAGTALAANQYGGIAGSDSLDELIDVTHARAT